MNRYFWALLAVSLLSLLGQHIYLTGKVTKVNATLAAERLASSKAVAQALQQRDEEKSRQGKLVAAVDAKWSKELKEQQNEAQARIDSIRSGTQRVYVRAKCPASPRVSSAEHPGVDNGTSYAELDPEVAARVYGLAKEGDAAIVALTAAQEILRGLQNKQKPQTSTPPSEAHVPASSSDAPK